MSNNKTTSEKKSEAMKAFYANKTPEERTAMAPWTGKHLSEEHKKTLSIVKTGKKLKPPITKKCDLEGCENIVRFKNGKFCSTSCNSKNNQKNKPTLHRGAGPESLSWVDGRSYFVEKATIEAKKLANYTCEACGKVDKYIDVHHLIPQRCAENIEENNQQDNLAVLCRSCHMASERAFMKEVIIRAFTYENNHMDTILEKDPRYLTLKGMFLSWLHNSNS